MLNIYYFFTNVFYFRYEKVKTELFENSNTYSIRYKHKFAYLKINKYVTKIYHFVYGIVL